MEMITNRRQPTNNNASIFSKLLISIVKVTFLLLLCGTSYLAGSLNGHQSTLDYTALVVGNEGMSVGRLIHGEKMISSDTPSNSDCRKVQEEFIELQVKKEVEEHRKKLLSERLDGNDTQQQQQYKQQSRRFPSKSMSKFINGISRVKKDELNDFFDFGNPIEQGKGTGQEDSIIIYQNKEAYPTDSAALQSSVEHDDGNGIPLTDTQSATENCDAMNVIFTDNPGNTRQCTAIIGNFESYHIQRFMKVDTVTSSKVQSDLPLKLVSRGYASRGKANFYSPPSDGKFSPVKRHWNMLKTFLQNVDTVLDDLRPILDKVAKDNSVVIMTCNMGQAALLMNFACSAKRRGFDLGNVLIFPSDVETRDLAEGLGLTTYYDEKVRADMLFYMSLLTVLTHPTFAFIYRTWARYRAEKQEDTATKISRQ